MLLQQQLVQKTENYNKVELLSHKNFTEGRDDSNNTHSVDKIVWHIDPGPCVW